MHDGARIHPHVAEITGECIIRHLETQQVMTIWTALVACLRIPTVARSHTCRRAERFGSRVLSSHTVPCRAQRPAAL